MKLVIGVAVGVRARVWGKGKLDVGKGKLDVGKGKLDVGKGKLDVGKGKLDVGKGKQLSCRCCLLTIAVSFLRQLVDQTVVAKISLSRLRFARRPSSPGCCPSKVVD